MHTFLLFLHQHHFCIVMYKTTQTQKKQNQAPGDNNWNMKQAGSQAFCTAVDLFQFNVIVPDAHKQAFLFCFLLWVFFRFICFVFVCLFFTLSVHMASNHVGILINLDNP